MLRKLYLSPLGYLISFVLNCLAVFHKPFMVYGFSNRVDRKFYKLTRIASNVKLINKEKIDIKNNVWIGYNCLLDGIGGIKIEEGVNIASHSCVYTHSSQNSIRILGNKFIEIPTENRPGYIIDSVTIGAYTFIGTSCVILSGTRIGKGCVVGAGSVLSGEFPDYSIVVGNPAKIVGDTRKTDASLYKSGVNFENYFDKETADEIKNNSANNS